MIFPLHAHSAEQYIWFIELENLMSMSHPGDTKNRGRTKIAGNETQIGNKAALQLEKRTEATRPQGRGGGKNRGDRRDTNKTFTTTNRRQPNHSNPSSR